MAVLSASRARLVLVLAVVGALLAGLVPPATAAATTRDACPRAAVPATRYVDTVRSTHRAAIDCASWWGIVQGRTATRFAPNESVTRGQVAAMLARLLRGTGVAPASVPSAGFRDTVEHRFERDIDLLAHLDIVQGVSRTRFAPNRPISRAQMASVLTRTFANAYRSPLPAGSVPFVDVPATSVHAAAIGQVTAAGIAEGTSATRFEPSRDVSRAQMATFTMRSTSRLVSLGRATVPTTRPTATDAYATRSRAVWVHLFDDTLKSRAGIQRLVDQLDAADVTQVFAQVIRRHDAYYTSEVLPRTVDPRLAPGHDVLATLLELAHARGIEVHAWFSVAPAWHEVYRNLPAPDGWVWTEHGRDAPVASRWVSRTHDGQWSTYLDPGVPAVRDHVARVVGEIARRYPVDGIHLDYVRYESSNHGYNPQALARYRADTGASGTPAPSDTAWSNWRRAQTREVIRRARTAIDRARSGVTLSAAVISWGDGPTTPDRAGFQRTGSYRSVLQDWDQWARDGAVDQVMPMNYFRAHDPQQAAWFARWIAYEGALAAATSTRVVPGIGAFVNQRAGVLDQTQAAMTAADGVAIYVYQQPTVDNDRRVLTDLARVRWRYPPPR
jgi:uncharacterized lipoprotein YddW (UPF0748 family)